MHLTQQTLEVLFGEGYELTCDKPIKGQFCSTTRAKVVGPKGTFERVAVMGPCRDFNQFELSLTDARTFGIEGAIRMSGDIENTPGFTVVGTKGEVTFDKGAIVAKRHIHLSHALAKEFDLKDGDSVLMAIESPDRKLIFDDTIVHMNKSATSDSKCHIDTDEGNAAGILGRMGTAFIVSKSE